MMLIYGGSLAKVLQYISKDSRELPIPVGNYKNEGRKGKAKAAVALLCEYVTYPIGNKNGSRKARRENLKRFSKIPTVGGINQLQAVLRFSIAGAAVAVCRRLDALIRDVS